MVLYEKSLRFLLLLDDIFQDICILYDFKLTFSSDDDVGQDLLPAGGSEEGSERLSVKDVEEMFNLPVLGHTTSEGRYAARLRRKGRVLT